MKNICTKINKVKSMSDHIFLEIYFLTLDCNITICHNRRLTIVIRQPVLTIYIKNIKRYNK